MHLHVSLDVKLTRSLQVIGIYEVNVVHGVNFETTHKIRSPTDKQVGAGEGTSHYLLTTTKIGHVSLVTSLKRSYFNCMQLLPS